MVNVHVNRLYPLGQLRSEMDRLFSEYFPQSSSWFNRLSTPRSFPPVNVWEKAEEYLAEAELPGVRQEDVDISVVGNELTIRGKRPEWEDKTATYHRQERGTGEFSRVLRLPSEIDADKVEALLRDGVLQIRLPKAAAARPRKITVNTK